MKKVFALMIALFLMNGAMSQWVPQNSGITNDLYSSHFINANMGFIIGAKGTILKTTDGGINWVPQITDTIYFLNSICFTNPDTGYAVGVCWGIGCANYGVILKTIDGGINWMPQFTDTTCTLYDVFFQNPDTGYIVGSSYGGWWEAYGIILKTIDGGSSWTINHTYNHFGFSDVCFPSNDTGFIMGVGFGSDAMGIILRTNDNGVTWTDTIIEERPVSPFMFTVSNGYAVSTDAMGETSFLKTTDGWESWIRQDLVEKLMWSISFTSVNVGYGLGVSRPGWDDNMIFKTTDGGSNWYIQDSILTGFPHTICFPRADTGYVVGDNGIILKTTNGGGFPAGIADNYNSKTDLKLYPNPSSTTITIETASKSSLSIHNTSGQQILQQQITKPKTTIDVSGWNSGVYMVKVVGEKGVSVGKFVKQ